MPSALHQQLYQLADIAPFCRQRYGRLGLTVFGRETKLPVKWHLGDGNIHGCGQLPVDDGHLERGIA